MTPRENEPQAKFEWLAEFTLLNNFKFTNLKLKFNGIKFYLTGCKNP